MYHFLNWNMLKYILILIFYDWFVLILSSSQMKEILLFRDAMLERPQGQILIRFGMFSFVEEEITSLSWSININCLQSDCANEYFLCIYNFWKQFDLQLRLHWIATLYFVWHTHWKTALLKSHTGTSRSLKYHQEDSWPQYRNIIIVSVWNYFSFIHFKMSHCNI